MDGGFAAKLQGGEDAEGGCEIALQQSIKFWTMRLEQKTTATSPVGRRAEGHCREAWPRCQYSHHSDIEHSEPMEYDFETIVPPRFSR